MKYSQLLWRIDGICYPFKIFCETIFEELLYGWLQKTLKYTLKLQKLYGDFVDMLLLFWNCGLEKKDNHEFWNTGLLCDITCWWIEPDDNFIVNNIRRMLLINSVPIIKEFQTLFPWCLVIEIILDFGTWFCLRFLMRVLWAERLAKGFSICCKGKFWIIFTIMKFKLWIPIGKRLH